MVANGGVKRYKEEEGDRNNDNGDLTVGITRNEDGMLLTNESKDQPRQKSFGTRRVLEVLVIVMVTAVVIGLFVERAIHSKPSRLRQSGVDKSSTFDGGVYNDVSNAGSTTPTEDLRSSVADAIEERLEIV